VVKDATEGQYRDGPWLVSGGWLPAEWGSSLNWWQNGRSPLPVGRTAIVQACISAYAQTVAMCPGSHWRAVANGGRERVTTSALSRLLRKPNAYQTPSDFLLNAVSQLYQTGNAYALAIRNDRQEPAELHLFSSRNSKPSVGEDGSVFYSLGGNELIERQLFVARGSIAALNGVPARDVLHIRLETPRHPLVGETPLMSAYPDMEIAGAAQAQSIAFFRNQSRPSGILSTDHILTKEQMAQLREAWEAQSKGLQAGGVPILSGGLKYGPMGITAEDAQLVERLKLTDQNIALAFRVPLQILGIGGTPFASTEALMQSWIAMGLGFALNHIEVAFDSFFNLFGVPDEYTEFDTRVLLRSALRERVTAYKEGVQGGIFSPNEARAEFELPAVEFGDEPRVQQQVVPLSFASEPPPPPAPPAAPAKPDNDDDAPDEVNADAEGASRDYSAIILQAARRHAERITTS
jgi:HK97 family phage portal protein